MNEATPPDSKNESPPPPTHLIGKEDEISVCLTPPSPIKMPEEVVKISDVFLYSEKESFLLCDYCDRWCNLKGPIDF